MSARRVIAALATAWGPRFGGINTFNTELVKSLGILPERDYDLICVIPGTATQEEIEDCRRFGVELRGIGGASANRFSAGCWSGPRPRRRWWRGCYSRRAAWARRASRSSSRAGCSGPAG
jgi:hypothetical protein